jgi:hypothetical protein
VRLIEWRDSFGDWRRSNRAMFGLYASYAALEIGDVHSTRVAAAARSSPVPSCAVSSGTLQPLRW